MSSLYAHLVVGYVVIILVYFMFVAPVAALLRQQANPAAPLLILLFCRRLARGQHAILCAQVNKINHRQNIQQIIGLNYKGIVSKTIFLKEKCKKNFIQGLCHNKLFEAAKGLNKQNKSYFGRKQISSGTFCIFFKLCP